jgi:hypothetical protein
VAKQLATLAGAISRDANFCRAGANLAANTLAMLQIEGIRDTAMQAPYPRLRRLLAALNGMEAVAGGTGFRFADPVGLDYSIAAARPV